MPNNTRANRRRYHNSTLRNRPYIRTYFLFHRNALVTLVAAGHIKKNSKDLRGVAIFQGDMYYPGNPNLSEKMLNEFIGKLETMRKHGVPGGEGAVYRTTDKTPAEFAKIAKKYGTKETEEWFIKMFEFIRDQKIKYL